MVELAGKAEAVFVVAVVILFGFFETGAEVLVGLEPQECCLLVYWPLCESRASPHLVYKRDKSSCPVHVLNTLCVFLKDPFLFPPHSTFCRLSVHPTKGRAEANLAPLIQLHY